MAAEICEIEFGTIGGKTLFREALSRGSSLEKVRRNARTFWLHDGPLARKRRAFAGELSGVSFLRLDRSAKLFAHAFRLDCESPRGQMDAAECRRCIEAHSRVGIMQNQTFTGIRALVGDVRPRILSAVKWKSGSPDLPGPVSASCFANHRE